MLATTTEAVIVLFGHGGCASLSPIRMKDILFKKREIAKRKKKKYLLFAVVELLCYV